MNENYRPGNQIGSEKQNQLGFTERAKARKTMETACTPDSVISDAHTAAVLVGKGNLCRVFGSAGTDVVAFGSSSLGLPTTSTATAAMLSQSCQIFVANADYIRTSAGVTRVEVIVESNQA